MRLIISPAKKMRRDSDSFAAAAAPQFLEQAEELRAYLQTLDYDQCRALWRCNDTIAALNFERVRHMDLRRAQTPALFSYDGIQYRYMAPNVFTERELSYVQEHLRILSGFYGLLRPFDGVEPYRLEMQAKLAGFRCSTLYEFWGASLAEMLAAEDACLVNLASQEYSKAVRPYWGTQPRWVECTFAEEAGGKRREKATQAKMARGAMVRYLAERQAQEPEEMRGFDRFGFSFDAAASSPDHFIFVKGA